MKAPLLPLLLCLALALPARGASGLEAPRTEAQAARARVRELREQQQGLRAELNTLAGRIEQLKTAQKGRLVAAPELDTALRRSQELSGQLTGLAQALTGAESQAEQRNLALSTALSEELARVRAEWDRTQDRAARAGLLERMRTLRTEREALRAALPASQVPALPVAEPGDDPADLLEQADALRDSEDKVNQRLRALRARITEVREERELDRRMNDFLGEESMFDEQDRHMRLRIDSATKDLSVAGAQRTRGGGVAGGAADYESTPVQTPSPAPPTAPGEGDPPSPTPPPAGDTALYPPPSRAASDSRPQVGGVRAQALASGDAEDVKGLEQEAARLESLARELDTRAGALEHRARELR